MIEGAGSVSELNLRDVDLVNLGLVTQLGAPWMLVADIERGGVFASVLGTVGLLDATERGVVSRLRDQQVSRRRSLFEDGVRILEERTASHCFGVFPYAPDITIDAEDSLALQTRRTAAGASRRADRHRPISVHLERDRLPAADVGRLD